MQLKNNSEAKLMLKDAGKPFPTGRPVGVLRWSYSATGETALPLTIS